MTEKPTGSRPRKSKPPYVTGLYDCYEERFTKICNFFIAEMICARKVRPQDKDWLLDAFRDQLASVLCKFKQEGTAKITTFAISGLKKRKHNVLRKYRSWCRHNAEIPSSSMNMTFPDDMNEENTRKYAKAMNAMEKEKVGNSRRQSLHERIEMEVSSMPDNGLKKICELLQTEKFLKGAAEKAGMTDKHLAKTELPRLRKYFESIGLDRNAVRRLDYEF